MESPKNFMFKVSHRTGGYTLSSKVLDDAGMKMIAHSICGLTANFLNHKRKLDDKVALSRITFQWRRWYKRC